jgi:hypothetical protein
MLTKYKLEFDAVQHKCFCCRRTLNILFRVAAQTGILPVCQQKLLVFHLQIQACTFIELLPFIEVVLAHCQDGIY